MNVLNLSSEAISTRLLINVYGCHLDFTSLSIKPVTAIERN